VSQSFDGAFLSGSLRTVLTLWTRPIYTDAGTTLPLVCFVPPTVTMPVSTDPVFPPGSCRSKQDLSAIPWGPFDTLFLRYRIAPPSLLSRLERVSFPPSSGGGSPLPSLCFWIFRKKKNPSAVGPSLFRGSHLYPSARGALLATVLMWNCPSVFPLDCSHSAFVDIRMDALQSNSFFYSHRNCFLVPFIPMLDSSTLL